MATDAAKAAECIIKVDDVEITSLYSSIVEVKVDMSRTKAAECTIRFESSRDSEGKWTVQDSGILEPWKKISLEADFGDVQEPLMSGYIRELEMVYPMTTGNATVFVIGQDDTLLLDREHIRRIWSTEESPMSDGEIVKQIASDFGLAADAEDGLTHTSLTQNDTSIKFLRDRAEANGFDLIIRESELYFGSLRLGETPQPPILVYAGPDTNCNRISIRYDGHLPDSISVVRAAQDAAEVEEEVLQPDLDLLGATGVTSDGKGLPPFNWAIKSPNGATNIEAIGRGQSKVNEQAWKIRARGELDGTRYKHVLLTHLPVKVDGVGETYDGIYYVDEVTHIFASDSYRQQFQLIRNALGG